MKNNLEIRFIFFMILITIYNSFSLETGTLGQIQKEKKLHQTSRVLQERPRQVTHYYSQKNLEQLSAKDIQLHAPLLILIDQKNQENSANDALGGLTSNFILAIGQKAYPIVVSTSLLVNLLERASSLDDPKHAENKELSHFELDAKDWEIYQSNGQQLILLLPKAFKEIHPKLGLKLGNLKSLTNQLPGSVPQHEKIKDFKVLLNYLKPFKSDNIVPDLKTIFLTTDDTERAQLPIWDFWITGHGRALVHSTIAGLTPEQVNELFSFLNNKLIVGVVYLQSCHIGGKNITLLEFEQTGVKRTNSFIVIIGSAFDVPIHRAQMKFITDFFNAAALLQDKNESLNQLVVTVSSLMPVTSVHGAESIPQVWLPNGIGFQTFNVNKDIFILSNVLAQVHADEMRPFTIEDKLAVLVYPSSIMAPLNISVVIKTDQTMPKNVFTLMKFLEEGQWELMPVLTQDSFWKDVESTTKKRTLEQLVSQYNSLVKLYTYAKDIRLQKVLTIYPTFISMNRANHAHYIKEINLISQNFPAGVMTFLRDAFLEISERSVVNSFYIQSLKGYNDISLLLHAARLIKNISEPHPLEKILESKKDQDILLEYVHIETIYNWRQKKIGFHISFTIDGTKWVFDDSIMQESKKFHYWNFKQLPFIAEQEKFYKNVAPLLKPSDQKTITRVLQKKGGEIIRKKIMEKRQKAAEQKKQESAEQ